MSIIVTTEVCCDFCGDIEDTAGNETVNRCERVREARRVVRTLYGWKRKYNLNSSLSPLESWRQFDLCPKCLNEIDKENKSG